MTDTHGLNLTTHRGAESVWERRGWNGTREQLTVARWLVGIGGGALALQALRRGTIAGSVLAGLGGGLACWALSGEGGLPDAGRWLRQAMERTGWRVDDRVHNESAESFPASDAPSWTPTVGAGSSRRVR